MRTDYRQPAADATSAPQTPVAAACDAMAERVFVPLVNAQALQLSPLKTRRMRARIAKSVRMHPNASDAEILAAFERRWVRVPDAQRPDAQTRADAAEVMRLALAGDATACATYAESMRWLSLKREGKPQADGLPGKMEAARQRTSPRDNPALPDALRALA